MTGEAIGFAMERCFEAGARDVFYTSVGMKKSRPGILLCTMCKVDDKDKIIKLIFKLTLCVSIEFVFAI